jgi:hypothetical protein
MSVADMGAVKTFTWGAARKFSYIHTFRSFKIIFADCLSEFMIEE